MPFGWPSDTVSAPRITGLTSCVVSGMVSFPEGSCHVAYLREALSGLFKLGEKPSAEQLMEWLPDRWLLGRTRDAPTTSAAAG